MVIRQKGLTFLVSIAAALLIVITLFSGKLIEWGLETAGRFVVGAKVEFDNVKFSPFFLKLSWGKLQVANPFDPWKNLFETDYTEMDLAFEPLILGRVIIQNSQIENIRFGTDRSSYGAIGGREPFSTDPVEGMRNQLQIIEDAIPVYNLKYLADLDVDSLLENTDLKSARLIDSLDSTVSQRVEEISENLNRLPDKSKLQQIRNQAKEIGNTPVESPEDAARALASIRELLAELDSLHSVKVAIDSSLQNQLNDLKRTNQLVSTALDNDYNTLLSQARIPDLSPSSITRAVFGAPLVDHVQSVLTYIGIARYYNAKIRELRPPKENPPRLLGQNILFSSKRNWPSLWIQRSFLSSTFANLNLQGEAQNISSQTYLVSRPISLLLSGKGSSGPEYELNILLDYITETLSETFGLRASGFSLDSVMLGPTPLLPVALSGQASLRSQIRAARFELEGSFSFSGENLVFDSQQDTDSLLASLYNLVAKSVKTLSMQSALSLTPTSYAFSLNSNVGEELAGIVNEIYWPVVDSLQNRIKSGLSKTAGSEREQINEQVSDLIENVNNELSVYTRQEQDLYTYIQEQRELVQNRARSKFPF